MATQSYRDRKWHFSYTRITNCCWQMQTPAERKLKNIRMASQHAQHESIGAQWATADRDYTAPLEIWLKTFLFECLQHHNFQLIPCFLLQHVPFFFCFFGLILVRVLV